MAISRSASDAGPSRHSTYARPTVYGTDTCLLSSHGVVNMAGQPRRQLRIRTADDVPGHWNTDGARVLGEGRERVWI